MWPVALLQGGRRACDPAVCTTEAGDLWPQTYGKEECLQGRGN